MKKLKTEKEWRAFLSPEQFRVLREKATEAPFTGKLLYNKQNGIYFCSGCSAELFPSTAKYDSGCGWPSFFQAGKNIETSQDNSHGMKRIEVHCKKCGGHLGHVFDDGPLPTGKRYCINSLAVGFKNEKTK